MLLQAQPRKIRKLRSPNAGWQHTFFVLLIAINCLNFSWSHEQARDDPYLDDSEVIVESSTHSLAFSLNNTDQYELISVTCKSAKNLDESVDDNSTPEQQVHICDNLDACTTYLATLSIRVVNGEEMFDKTLDATTSYVEPRSIIVELEPFTEAINMTWATTDNACVSEYEVQVKSVNKQYKWTKDKTQTQLLMDGLNACQEHYIQFITYDINKQFISNITANSTTKYTEPGNVTSITILPYDNAQMKVSWQQPSYYTCINYYYFTWSLVDCPDHSAQRHHQNNTDLSTMDDGNDVTCEWSAKITDGNANQYIITTLQGCEDYIFQIYIDSETNLKSEPTPFTAPERVPGTVTIETPELSSMNVTLHWLPPQTNSKCVNVYRVHLIGPLQHIEEEDIRQAEINATSVFFDQLDPCGKYNFSIRAISLNGTAGQSVSSVFEALETNPSQVLDEVVIQEPYALNISWQPPAVATLCLNGYRLSGWDDENNAQIAFDKLTNETSVRIDSLQACQAYTIQIIATTKTMDGALKFIETDTAATISQPPKFQSLGVVASGVYLSAQASDSDFTTNKCETIFARFVCRTSSNVPHKSAERYVEGVVGDISFKTHLSPLSPNTKYDCYASFFNIAGWSETTKILETTGPYFPGPPESVLLKARSNTSVFFSWKEPIYPNGNIKLYIVHFQWVKVNYYRPPTCSVIIREPIMRETSSLEQTFSSLQSYTMYSMQVAAQNEYGVGDYTRPFMMLTESSPPEPVTNMDARTKGPYLSDTEYKASVLVSWMAPCQLNGEVEYFLLEFNGQRSDYETVHYQRNVLPEFETDGSISYNETDLKPEYEYTVSVKIMTATFESSAVQRVFTAPAGIPKKLNDSSVNKMQVDPFEADNPTYSAVVRLPVEILDSDAGDIPYVALLVSEKHCNQEPQLRYDALNTKLYWPDTLTWQMAYEHDSCIKQYQTTPQRWDPMASENSRSLSRTEDSIIYTIGKEVCTDSADGYYCNGPLKADTEYNLVVRLFTNSGYSDAALLEFRTDSLIQLTLILVSVCTSLFVALIAGLVYFWMAKRISAKRQSCHGIEDALGDIMAKNYALYFRDISRPEKVAREFQELNLVAMDLSTAASELGYNKNRYADIFPYDKNRVILDIDSEGSDYINASFIDGYRRKKEYIATQGPKPESTMDFWRMILQHNVRVIVMVTQFCEGYVVKCHEYFPYESKGINVTVKKTDHFELYDRTEMFVSHELYSMKQKVVHFYFKKWPDHGCPYDPQQLITFLRKVKAEKLPTYSPIVVHCSAGVGRTGTFIGLDIIMQRLRTEKKINIYETVKKLRFQRMKMVQTLTQYRFLYSCAYELVKHKHTANTHRSKKKKVSFQDDPETGIVATVAQPTKLRCDSGDLPAVVEEVEAKQNKLSKDEIAMTWMSPPSNQSNDTNKQYDSNGKKF